MQFKKSAPKIHTETISTKIIKLVLGSSTPERLPMGKKSIFRRVRNQWRTERWGLGCSTPPPEILKALQNRAKLYPIVKTVKNC